MVTAKNVINDVIHTRLLVIHLHEHVPEKQKSLDKFWRKSRFMSETRKAISN